MIMNPDNEKPGAPPETEPVKPQTSGEDKPSFSFRDLELIDIVNVDGYRNLSFMVRGEFIVVMRQWEYFNYLDFIFEQLELLSQEGEESCKCDLCSPPHATIEENFKITAQMLDIENQSVVEEKDKYIKIYEIYDLIPSTIVGGICKTDEQ